MLGGSRIWRISTGWYAQGRIHFVVGREAREMGRQRAPLCGLGNLSSEGISRGAESVYASQSSSWFGQIIQRSDDGGKTWRQPGTPAGEPTTTPEGTPKAESNKFVYDTSPETGEPLTTHQ